MFGRKGYCIVRSGSEGSLLNTDDLRRDLQGPTVDETIQQFAV